MESPLFHHDEEEDIYNNTITSPNLSTTIENCCTVVTVDLTLKSADFDKCQKNNNNCNGDDEDKEVESVGVGGAGGDGNASSAVTPAIVVPAISNSNSSLTSTSTITIVEKPPAPCWKRYIGITLGLASCACFSLTFLIAKSMPQYHPFSLASWRFVGVFLFSFGFLIYYGLKLKGALFNPIWPLTKAQQRKTFIILVFRGIFGTTSAVLSFCALTFMEVADMTVIAFSTPVFVTVVAFFVLGERFSLVPVFAAVLTLGGVVIIARPPFLTGATEFDYNLMMGTILSFISMAFSTCIFIILRYLRHVNFSIITTSFGLIGLIQCNILCAIVNKFEIPKDGWDLFLGFSLGFLTFLGQLFFTAALKFETSSSISLIRTCDVIFSFMWQLILLNVYPDFFSLLGATVVISGVLLVAFVKWLGQLPESSRVRRTLWFLVKY